MPSEQMIKIFCIGGSGLIGSRIIELLSSKYQFTLLSRSTGVDITNPQTLKAIEKDHEHPIILHLAGKTDVDSCEEDKERGREGEAWKANVLGVSNIIEAACKTNKKIIYFSTDFVFDGEKGNYSETDTPNPINWYGITKYEGEKIITSSSLPHLIIRPAYPYRANEFEKKDFLHTIILRLKNHERIQAVVDHIFTPTFVDDIARALDALLQQDSIGVYHIVGSQSLTPYEAAVKIADTFGFDKTLISKVTLKEFFAGRAPRPFNLSMKNDKISSLGVKMKTFDEGLQQVMINSV